MIEHKLDADQCRLSFIQTQPGLCRRSAKSLTTGSYANGNNGSRIAPSMVSQASHAENPVSGDGKLQNTVDIVYAALSGVNKTDGASFSGGNRSSMRAASTESNSVQGSCRGNGSYSISGNEQTGSFSGSTTNMTRKMDI
ncbi:MAG TPA: hypothetical protein ENK38_04695 [Gammaproteobacteria bacterium]|nr:hypothetical protein [Gammaproteobacteria bacterium]